MDGFLEEVTQELEELLRNNSALTEENATLKALVAEYKDTERELRNTLVTAQRMCEEFKSSSERDAELRIKQAELEADKLMQTADRMVAPLVVVPDPSPARIDHPSTASGRRRRLVSVDQLRFEP